MIIKILETPCPYCGETSLFIPDGWEAGGPAVCANPECDSQQPEEQPDLPPERGGDE